MFTKKNIPAILLITCAFITLVFGLLVFVIPPAIFPDPSWGFQVMRSMQMGGGFNMLVSPDQDDITKNIAEFLSWWSPGQYMVPYLFIKLLGVNMGQSTAITITLCALTGLAGYYQLFKKLGFSPLISAISIAFIVCQQFFVIPYVFYNGGEVLIFAFSGWFLYGCISFNKPGLWLVLFILLSGWMGFFCKSAFLWIFASGLLCLWIRFSTGKKNWKDWMINGIWLGVPALISVAAIFKFYMSKGTNPTASSGGLKLVWETFGFPIASPLLAGFSVDDLFHGLVFNSDGGMFSHSISVLILLLLAVLSVALVLCLIRFIPNANYSLFVIVFYAVSILFFGQAFLKQSAISYEGRHFRVVGLLVIPGVIYLFSQLRLQYRLLFALFWLGITYSSAQFVISGYRYNVAKSAHGNSGLSQGFIDQQSLNAILALDRQQRNALFVFTSADLGLEIVHNRIVNLEPVPDDLKVDPESYIHAGHGGPLYILLPASYVAKKAAIVIKNFPNYQNFKLTRLSSAYVLYHAQ